MPTMAKAKRKKETKDHVLTVRISRRVYERVERVAEREDRTVGYIVRRMIENHLARERDKKGKRK